MKELRGRGVSGGIAVGKIFFLEKADKKIIRRKVDNVRAELERLSASADAYLDRLMALKVKTYAQAGEDSSMIFETHSLMLMDPDFMGEIENMIQSQSVNAEYAVKLTGDRLAESLRLSDSEYMRERAADVEDITDGLIDTLSGRRTSLPAGEKFIVAAEDLSPGETASFDRDSVLAFITKYGSATSHTSILARTMGIPAIVGIDDINPDWDGRTACADGNSGAVYIDPDRGAVKAAEEKLRLQKENDLRLSSLIGRPSVTAEGRKIMLFANITTPADIDAVLSNDAEGIGLFRSEFMYMDRRSLPSEEELFSVYSSIAARMGGKPVIIRTLDIGADKKAPGIDLGEEENPALGLRAIRLCLKRRDIFKTQLRAIYRASLKGNIYIMLPMITTKKELEDSLAIAGNARAELKSDGIEFKDVPVGIMIETPSAALISDELAELADFFSVGTNDLTQYTLACDRQNPALSDLYDPSETSVLRLIKLAADNIHKKGKWIGVCGEAAADRELLEIFMSMGIDELSVSPKRVLYVRDALGKAAGRSSLEKYTL